MGVLEKWMSMTTQVICSVLENILMAEIQARAWKVMSDELKQRN
jgi:hypothetical protein